MKTKSENLLELKLMDI